MYIVNQDRDQIYYHRGNLMTRPAIVAGKVFGINLYSDDNFLGTFDSPKEALDEMTRIANCNKYLCFVSGYSKWDVWEMLKGVMRDEMDD